MKKIFDLSLGTLATLAIATMASSAFAGQWAGSIRGDTGPTGSQVIFEDASNASNRSDWEWDFTGRLMMYTSCSPCSTYVAASWQGANHTVNSVSDLTFGNRVSVRNDFSKTKLGMGVNVFKNHCLALTMEFGANYLDAKLHVDKDYVQPVSGPRPVDAENGESRAKTSGLGLYSSVKGEYRFASVCFSNAWSIYGKAELADIIGHQRYDYTPANGSDMSYANRYNNIVEVDLEAALVYAPAFKCWDNMNMSVAFGVRTDSFVNLFRHVDDSSLEPTASNAALLSLARPSLFLEVGIKL